MRFAQSFLLEPILNFRFAPFQLSLVLRESDTNDQISANCSDISACRKTLDRAAVRSGTTAFGEVQVSLPQSNGNGGQPGSQKPKSSLMCCFREPPPKAFYHQHVGNPK